MKAAGIAFLLSSLVFAQDPEVLFESARNKEVVAGDLKGAIEQYKAVMAASASNRPLAAKAMLQIGESQEKLGQRDAALATYAKLAKDYADQPGIAGLAKARAEAMAVPAVTGPQMENLDFASGEAGQVPPGWFVPPVLRDAGYRSELRRTGCGIRPSCVVIMTVPDPPQQHMFGNLMQSIDASGYQGKTVRLRARLRLEATVAEDSAQMWLRVDRPNQLGGGAFDNMGDRPVKAAQWTNVEIVAKVVADAARLNIGVMSIGKGKAWVEGMTLEVVPDSTPNTAKVLAPQGTPFGVATGSFPYKDALGKRVRFSGYIKTEGITRGYAGLWWRVDGKTGSLAFDNMGDRGVRGSTDWQRYEIELPVAADATNINFGALLTGNGQAYFDSLSVELDGAPYSKPALDLDFEGSTPVAFYMGGQGYEVRLDPKAARTGRQGLRMTYTGPATEARRGFGVATATFPVAVAAGKSARFSGFIKTQNVTDGYAGLWWRVDGVEGPNRMLAFNNMDKTGPRGTTDWQRFEIVLPVAKEAKNINFGALLTGKGTAWFDALTVELDGVPYLDRSVFDLDFEAPTVKGMYTGGEGYRVQLDKETVMRGTQSLRMQSVQ